MIRFNSDYTEGAHPEVLQHLIETNDLQTDGYGVDPFCQNAAAQIRNACADESLAVHFLVGGTQTNLTVIAAALRPHQSVLTATSGHIAVHETGAIEAVGHKCETLATDNGKITAAQVRAKLKSHLTDEAFEHATQPKLVYISQPTEVGTVYTRDELTALRDVCDEFNLLLYMDGARLSYALTCPGNDLDLQTIASLCDVFYIGGTKAGLLFGEAVVIRNNDLKKDFRYLIKQKGGMLAKGRLLGVQFQALFTNNLYERIGYHANHCAMIIRDSLREAGVRFRYDSPTNQIFPIFSDQVVAKIRAEFAVSYIERINEQESCIRICTSFATKEENARLLTERIRTFLESLPK